jgi:hypothetical protein
MRVYVTLFIVTFPSISNPSSLCVITNKPILLIIIDRLNFNLMLHTKSTICLNENNLNRNANDIHQDLNSKNKFLHRLIQSSTDLKINDLYCPINSHQNNGAIRIESALMTSDYSHLLLHASRPIVDLNMNRTIDLIKRNGAGDENSSSKQVQTPIITDNNHYLTLEQVPIYNRRTVQFTSKQLILISISVFVFVIVLCLTTIFFIL